jgi:predicted nuclease of predicted toxin-antitoxin system
MKFKIDENLPIEAAELLQQNGHDAITVLEQNLGGEADSHIAQVCQTEERALITLDTDFSDIRTYPPRQFPGLIVLRLRWQDRLRVLEALQRVIQVFASEPLEGQLWIVEEERIRIRE